MSDDLKEKIEETEENIQKIKYLRRKTMLIISITILMGLLIIFGDVSRRFSKIEDNDYSVYKIRENILYVFEGRNDPKVEYEVDSSDDSGSGGGYHEQHIDYNIVLSDKDLGPEEVRAFLFPETKGIAVPGISQVNNYLVEVNCSADADLKLALESFSGSDDILDVLYAKISVNEEQIFDNTFRKLKDNFAHFPVEKNAVNSLTYEVNVYIPPEVEDNFSIDGDGDYQGKSVNFTLKWWI